MIALSEASPKIWASASLRDICRTTEAAKLAGWRVYHIPQEWPGMTVEDALCHIPVQGKLIPGLWIYIPLPERSLEVYTAARALNIYLINDPDEFQRAEEFDQFYPLIADLTAESIWVESLDQFESAGRRPDRLSLVC